METLFDILYFLPASDPLRENAVIAGEMFGGVGFQNTLFLNSFLMMIFGALLLNILYYMVINTWLRWNVSSFMSWIITMILSGAIAYVIAFYCVVNILFPYPQVQSIPPFGWKFIFMHTLYGALFFFLFSLLFKRLSLNAKATPF